MRTFCISLPESTDRHERQRQHFKEVGLKDWQFFWGINGEVAGLRTEHPYLVDNPEENYHIGPKTIGIWLSHFMLWGALTLLPGSHFMILEDDAKFLPGWERGFQDAMRDVPQDFDVLFVGSCCTVDRQKTLVTGNVHEVKYPMCLQCYVVAKKCLDTFVRTQRKIYAPIDISIVFHTFPQLTVYTVLPRLVEQFETYIPV